MLLSIKNGWGDRTTGSKPHLNVLYGTGTFLKRELLSISVTWERALEPKHAARTEGEAPWVGQMGYSLVFPRNHMISTLHPHDHGIWEELSWWWVSTTKGAFHLETRQLPSLMLMASYSSNAGKCQKAHITKLVQPVKFYYSQFTGKKPKLRILKLSKNESESARTCGVLTGYLAGLSSSLVWDTDTPRRWPKTGPNLGHSPSMYQPHRGRALPIYHQLVMIEAGVHRLSALGMWLEKEEGRLLHSFWTHPLQMHQPHLHLLPKV